MWKPAFVDLFEHRDRQTFYPQTKVTELPFLLSWYYREIIVEAC